MLHPALAAAEELDATVANMRFVKPLDVELVLQLAREHDALVTVEENVVAGGAGSAVAEALAAAGIAMPVLQLGLPDAVHRARRSRRSCSRSAGSTRKGIAASIRARFGAAHAGARGQSRAAAMSCDRGRAML